MINGAGYEGASKFSGVEGTSVRGPAVLDYNVSTVNGQQLIFSGWVVAEGGVEKYVWSIDGGKTWIDCSLKGYDKLAVVTQEYIDNASNRLNGYAFTNPKASMNGAGFQSSTGVGANARGLVADLTDYAGQKVDIILAAVPVNEQDSLCVLVSVKGVNVAK